MKKLLYEIAGLVSVLVIFPLFPFVMVFVVAAFIVNENETFAARFANNTARKLMSKRK